MPTLPRRMATFAMLAAVSVLVVPALADDTLAISDLRLGFQSFVKPGHWIPAAVDVTTKGEPFNGTVEIVTTDNDGLPVSIVSDLFVDTNQTRSAYSHVKLGDARSPIEVRLRTVEGKEVAWREFALDDPALRLIEIPVGASLFVYYGAPGGLYDLTRVEPAGPVDRAFARILAARDLPTQWFDYSGVRAMILATADLAQLELIDPGRASALRSWVRQGGHLVISAASHWQAVQGGFLGPMLPATVSGMGKVRSPARLESFARSKSRLDERGQGLSVATLTKIRGTVTIQDEGQPLVVTGAYGLGKVTLLTFDTDQEPFRSWTAAPDFWLALLNLPPVQAKSEPAASRRFGIEVQTDLATALGGWLEEFPNVTVVPFHWVAILILGYILLIGPIDYFFLKKVVGRLELTWITFPTTVVVVSLAAYFAAYWLKGTDLRLNRVEVVDVDVGSRTLRGSAFVSIFSPRIDRYSLWMEPGLGAAGTWAELGMGRDQTDLNASWMGTPESYAFRGVGNGGGAGLLGRRGYAYDGPTARGLRGVPIQVWSVKAFTGRWLAQADKIATIDLRPREVFLSGSVVNHLDVPLEDATLFFGEYLDRLGTIPAKGSIIVRGERPLPIKGNLVGGGIDQLRRNAATAGQMSQVNARDIVLPILFAGKMPETAQYVPSRYLRDLDLSDHLGLGQAILLARVSQEGSRLWLNQPPNPDTQPAPVPGVVRTETYIRLLIDVAGAAK